MLWSTARSPVASASRSSTACNPVGNGVAPPLTGKGLRHDMHEAKLLAEGGITGSERTPV